MTSNKVTLLLPGYTSTFQRLDDPRQDGAGTTQLNAPVALRFSHDLRQQPWLAQLAQCLNVDVAEGKRLPSARLCLAAQAASEAVSEHEQSTDSALHLVRADPVYLKADRDNATLIAPEQLQLSDDEADQLLLALNEFNKDDGLVFFRHKSYEWFMSGMQADALETYPPSFLANRKAGSFLPDGDAAAGWRRLLTEMQMLLHAHPVNMDRERRGLMPVNSVWFWGGAQLPEPQASCDTVTLYAEDVQAVALAEHLGVTTKPLSAIADVIQQTPSQGAIIIVDTRIATAWLAGDEQQLKMALQQVNQQMLEPLCRQVALQQLARIDVLTEDGLQGVCNPDTLSESTRGDAKGQPGWLKRLFGIVGR